MNINPSSDERRGASDIVEKTASHDAFKVVTVAIKLFSWREGNRGRT